MNRFKQLKFLTFILLLAASACSEQPSPSPTSAPATPPSHMIVSVENRDFGEVPRLLYKIKLPSHYSRPKVETIAQSIVAKLKTRGAPIGAVSMLFYGPNSALTGAYDIASVDWAPNGQWSAAGTNIPGNYESFRLAVLYNEPRATSKTVIPVSSKVSGLFGVPVPAKAILVEKSAGNKAERTDSREQYSVSATAADILGFFVRELPKAGWKSSGPEMESFLIFEKGERKMVIIINDAGNSFTLMGS